MKINSINMISTQNTAFSSRKKVPDYTVADDKKSIKTKVFIGLGALATIGVAGILIAKGKSKGAEKIKNLHKTILSSNTKKIKNNSVSNITKKQKPQDISTQLPSLSKKPPIKETSEISKAIEKSGMKTSTKTTILKNGIKKTDQITTGTIEGTRILSTLEKPVNGVKSFKISKFANGDFSSLQSFDTNGKLLKDINFTHNYLFTNKLLTVEIKDSKKGRTFIRYGYDKNFDKLKNVTTIYPDGSKKITKIPNNLKAATKTLLDNTTDKLYRFFSKK